MEGDRIGARVPEQALGSEERALLVDAPIWLAVRPRDREELERRVQRVGEAFYDIRVSGG